MMSGWQMTPTLAAMVSPKARVIDRPACMNGSNVAFACPPLDPHLALNQGSLESAQRCMQHLACPAWQARPVWGP